MEKPLIIQYLNLLHKYRDPNAKPVRRFVRKHVDDEVFIRRMGVIRSIFILSTGEKESLQKLLHPEEKKEFANECKT